MAIAATWVVAGTSVTSSAALYTVPSNTASTYSYVRDLVINNGGPSTLFVALGTGATAASTAQSMQIPAGGSLILSQCQVPNSGIIYGVSSGTSATFIGYGSNVSYV